MKLIKKIGFSRTTYLEAVTIFYDSSDSSVLNIVPLGFKLRENYIVSKIFRNSRTFNIIVNNLTKQGCICVTQDPRLFYLSIFEKNKAVELFTTKRKNLCDAEIEFSIEYTENYRNNLIVYFKPTKITIYRKIPRGFTRASASIIEALIWLTKIPYARKEKKIKLIKHIEYSLESVARSSKSSVYKSITQKIHTKILELINTK